MQIIMRFCHRILPSNDEGIVYLCLLLNLSLTTHDVVVVDHFHEVRTSREKPSFFYLDIHDGSVIPRPRPIPRPIPTDDGSVENDDPKSLLSCDDEPSPVIGHVKP